MSSLAQARLVRVFLGRTQKNNVVNQGLFARPGSQISDFIFYSMRLRGATVGEPIEMCPNCAWILGR
jgi:hypothetical protein